MDDFKRPLRFLVFCVLSLLFARPLLAQDALDEIEALFNEESRRIEREQDPATTSPAALPGQ